MSETTKKSNNNLRVDLKIYDPTNPDIRAGTEIKLKNKELDSIKAILVKYFS